jgi:hypothetical protein
LKGSNKKEKDEFKLRLGVWEFGSMFHDGNWEAGPLLFHLSEPLIANNSWSTRDETKYVIVSFPIGSIWVPDRAY